MSFLIMVAILLGAIAIGIPVAFSLCVAAFAGILLTNQSVLIIPHVIYSALDNFVLLAIPLYILMGHIMLKGGIGETIFNWADSLLRHLPGGLLIASVMSCAIFAAISGSSVATALTIGMVAYPSMMTRGYSKRVTLGALAAGGTLGILIPPSIPMILYGTITEESVGKLFIAGIIPGIIMTILLCVYCILICIIKPDLYKKSVAATWHERWRTTLKMIPIFSLPIIVIGGIYSGMFTPTEAAAVGVICSIILCINRICKKEVITEILRNTAKTSIMLLTIVAGAKLFGHVMTTMQVTQELTQFIVSMNVEPWMFIAWVSILLLFLGMLLDPSGIILITTPIFLPVLQALEIDLIYFGILFVINMELGNVTPPVGMNLFVLAGISKDASYEDVVRGVFPFIIVLAIGFMIMFFFPSLSTWLPANMK